MERQGQGEGQLISTTESSIAIERAIERIRKERETFNQRKRHEERWFGLRLVMGYTSVLLLLSIMVVSTVILFTNYNFPTAVVITAGAALFVDALGLIAAVWKIALNPSFPGRLEPVTDSSILRDADTDRDSA